MTNISYPPLPPDSFIRDKTLTSRLSSEERVKVKVNSIRAFSGHSIDSLYYQVVQTQMQLLCSGSGVSVRSTEDGQTDGPGSHLFQALDTMLALRAK